VTNPEFFHLRTVGEALELLLTHWHPPTPTETIATSAGRGRVLAVMPVSPIDLPEFARSSVDGYAVRAADTYGASQTLPTYLRLTTPVLMGRSADTPLNSGEAAPMPTGGMLPPNADAVVMIEHTQRFGGDEIEVLRPCAVGENVVQVGEDVSQGQALFSRGHRLRPADIGALLALGITQVEVITPPRVAILGSGDELVPPPAQPAPGQIRDVNSAALAALVDEYGGIPVEMDIARDEYDDLLGKAREGLASADILLITAGSSVGARDLTLSVINGLGAPGVLQHGLAVKPGKPTILAVCEGKAVIGLPGNPVSALLVARQIVGAILSRWYGAQPINMPIRASLTANVPSASGREDTIPVRLSLDGNGDWLAEPIFGKSALIFTLAQADGVLTVPLDVTGLKVGTLVDVERL
jgi:molybdopterin molybdotransferase